MLIIYEGIDDSERIYKVIKEKEASKHINVKLYCRDDGKIHDGFDDFSPENKDEVQAGTIIVATNIAGRGTDILPSIEVEKNEGLHVTDLCLGEFAGLGNLGVGQ